MGRLDTLDGMNRIWYTQSRIEVGPIKKSSIVRKVGDKKEIVYFYETMTLWVFRLSVYVKSIKKVALRFEISWGWK